MKREEEIKQASKSYASKMCDLCLDEYCKEKGLVCHQFKEYIAAYSKGIKWADENPKNVWHDVSEMPNNHSYIMLMIDHYTIKTDYVPACLKHCQLNRDNWNEFVKNTNMKRWAYVSDLLPKGGEL